MHLGTILLRQERQGQAHALRRQRSDGLLCHGKARPGTANWVARPAI